VRRIHGDKGHRGHNYPTVQGGDQGPGRRVTKAIRRECALPPPSSPRSAISMTIVGCVSQRPRWATRRARCRRLQLRPASPLVGGIVIACPVMDPLSSPRCTTQRAGSTNPIQYERILSGHWDQSHLCQTETD
jgi:hypothetical protein